MRHCPNVVVRVDGVAVEVGDGATIAAAIEQAAAGRPAIYRRSVGGAGRAALCGMGVCKECRVTIDGRAHRLACMTRCEPGMMISTRGD
ncbi:2Fe-2S iron-sulfur cluster-binding protein [Thiomonas sp. FB-Cd]|uniref:2Fe-2S iron-sulfur cluster-binding protein n=1 Tax=Thiomonas sp. FB-Cd TaxID=1158292 RepID=UPI0004DF15BB|nr:2Fe-2S iron-sulfur cluster-binding protein [Thiomonas sp. FB-Cd]